MDGTGMWSLPIEKVAFVLNMSVTGTMGQLEDMRTSLSSPM